MVSVGTGLGGGMVVNGSLMRGFSGLAGEVGHVRFSADGHPCACGARGCWEQYASGNALGRRARDAVTADPKAGAAIVAAAGGSISAVDGHAVAQALSKSDALAHRLIADVGHDLGEGLAGLVAVLDPQIVVIGGGVAAHGDLLIEPAQSAMAQRLVGHAHRVVPTLRPARLGGDAALIGAALAR
jgi:glucokinase